MNKIIIDKEENIALKDDSYQLDINTDKLVINIEGTVLINDISEQNIDNLNLTINIKDNANLIYNRFRHFNKLNNNITINQKNNSNVIFNYSLLALDQGHIKFQSNLEGNNNNTQINIKAITEKKGKIIINCTSNAKKKTCENTLLENIRILLLNNEESIIIPDLLVSSNEVEVNHAATLSGLKDDELFYLQSKGISLKSSEELLKTGFLINNLSISEENQNKIKEIIGR